jgi:hypothetical protein
MMNPTTFGTPDGQDEPRYAFCQNCKVQVDPDELFCSLACREADMRRRLDAQNRAYHDAHKAGRDLLAPYLPAFGGFIPREGE